MAKFCTNCGNKLEDNYNVCPSCGTPSPNIMNQGVPNNQYGYYPNQQYYQNPPVQETKVEVGFVILGFFIPIVGWILWGIWSKTKPRTAKAAGIAGIIGFVVNFIISIVVSGLFFSTFYY